MGCKTSPYQAGQGILFAEEVVRGDPLDPTNMFHFDAVCLNLPRSDTYQPQLSWVQKTWENKLACDVFIYVDDGRTTGNSYETCWQSAPRLGSVLNLLGIQDVPPVTWASSIVSSINNAVSLRISPDHWIKAQAMVSWIDEAAHYGEPIHHKTLESYKGTLAYCHHSIPQGHPSYP
jgi:hypothetical protein